MAKTFGKNWLPGNTFKVWRDKWEDDLTDAEQTLWHHVQELRDIDEHGEGVPLIPVAIPVAIDDCVPTNAALLGLSPGHQPTATKIGAGFNPYPNKAASEVCAEYLQLCQQWRDPGRGECPRTHTKTPKARASRRSPRPSDC